MDHRKLTIFSNDSPYEKKNPRIHKCQTILARTKEIREQSQTRAAAPDFPGPIFFIYEDP